VEDLPGVGRTAIGVAYARAVESSRPDRLFDDPYAQALLAGAAGLFGTEARLAREPGSVAATVGAAFGFHAAIRTRFFDDFLLGACAHGIRQVVLLAAGLDARAYRLVWPDLVRLYEVDLPDMLAFKARILTERGALPGCARIAVPVDLRTDWSGPLLAAGFDPTRPTAWLAEGLLIYLTAEQAAALLTTVGDLSTPGSRLALEHGALSAELGSQVAQVRQMDQYTSLWRGGLGRETLPWLAGHGWLPVRHETRQVAAALGRTAPEHVAGALIEATRAWLAAEPIAAERLDLEPVRVEHAAEVARALDDAGLHEFTGGRPATVDELRERYARWAVGHSPDGTQGWLNWVIRRRDTGAAVGTMQVTLTTRGAELAWVVAVAQQGRGYAREAALATVDWLRAHGVTALVAHIHPDHRASMAIATVLGLRPTEVTVDGETQWTNAV
jgi:methyltransferase (TIGR00027 family)